MGMRIESSRLLTYKAAALKDEGKPYSKVRHPAPLMCRLQVEEVAAGNMFWL